jgi:hypothetical protein
MFLNGSHGALRRVVAVGVLAFGAAVAQAEQVMPERFALLEQQQVALVCVAAINVRGDQAMRNEDSTIGERLTALRQYMFARRVWMLDAKVEDALLNHWTRSFESQSAVERSAQSSYCFAAAAASVDAMPEHDVRRLRAEGYDTAQMVWARYQATARAEGDSVGALTR